MTENEREQLRGVFWEIIRQKDMEGINALADHNENDYYIQLINELESLKDANKEKIDELTALCKFIRNKLWDYPRNTSELYLIIHLLNTSFNTLANAIGYPLIYSIDGILEYILLLYKYKESYAPKVDKILFEEITDEIMAISMGKIIRAQWDDVLGSADGMDTFIRVFDDVFTSAIQRFEDKFIHSLTKNEVLSRCVLVESCDESRFIPWPNHTSNRWNPPGKTYLYLSPKEQEVPYTPSGITGGQYVCLLECRARHGQDVCFCDFATMVPGRILDLAYNDVSLYFFRKMIEDENQRVINGSIERILNSKEVYDHIQDEAYIKNMIHNDIEMNPFSIAILSESIAKQYLKLVCGCIYEKVDDANTTAKNRAYKSFQILAEYLESKGITGIIYPSTRTHKMSGKNLVLFNVGDAKPIMGTVKKFHYN